MTQTPSTLRQANAYAMQYGLILGLIGILGLVVSGISISVPALSLFGTLIAVGSTVVAAFLTTRFRKATTTSESGFGFGRAFTFTFIMGVYATLIVGMFVYIYMAFIDGGYLVNAYERLLTQPEAVAEMRRSGVQDNLAMSGMSINDLLDTMRAIPPIQYASSFIFTGIVAAPFISAVIALLVRRKPVIFGSSHM